MTSIFLTVLAKIGRPVPIIIFPSHWGQLVDIFGLFTVIGGLATNGTRIVKAAGALLGGCWCSTFASASLSSLPANRALSEPVPLLVQSLPPALPLPPRDPDAAFVFPDDAVRNCNRQKCLRKLVSHVFCSTTAFVKAASIGSGFEPALAFLSSISFLRSLLRRARGRMFGNMTAPDGPMTGKRPICGASAGVRFIRLLAILG